MAIPINQLFQLILEEHQSQRTLHVTTYRPIEVELPDQSNAFSDYEWGDFFDSVDSCIPGTLLGRVRYLTSNAHYKPRWDSPGRTHATFGNGCLRSYNRPLRTLTWAKRSEPWCKLFSDMLYLRAVVDPDLQDAPHVVTFHLEKGSIFKNRHLPTLYYWAQKYGYATLPPFVRQRAEYHIEKLLEKLKRDRPISYFSVEAKWQVKYLELAGILDD